MKVNYFTIMATLSFLRNIPLSSFYLHHSLDDFIKAWDFKIHISSVQLLSHVRLFATPWTAACQLPCPSPTPGVHSNSCPSSQWCHPAISSSVIPFSSCFQSLLASESFPMSQLFAWGGQSTGASALASFLPKKSQGWSPLEWTGHCPLISAKLKTIQFRQL